MLIKKFLLILFPLLLIFGVISCEKNNAEDPYLWLEKVDGEKALSFAKTHNEATVNILEKVPEFKDIYEKNLEIYNSNERIAYPSIRGKYVYNFWKDDKNKRGLLRRTTLTAYLKGNIDWETVLDIDALSEKEGKKWVYKGASYLFPDNKFCLMRLSDGGGDAVEIREFNLKTKEFVKDGFFVPHAKGSASWIDYNTIFVRTDFGKGSMTTSGYPRIAKRWKRGTPLSSAETVFSGDSTDVSVSAYVLNAPSRSYQMVSRGMTFYTSNTYVIENGKQIKLDIPDDSEFDGFFKNQMMIQLKTDWTLGDKVYPQGVLLSIDYDQYLKGERNFTIVVSPDENSSIVSISNTKNYLLVNMIKNVKSTVYAFTLKKGKWHENELNAPKMGTIYLGSSDDFSDKFFYTFTGFLDPSSLYFANGISRKAVLVKQLPAFFEASGLQVNQKWAVSKDGTKIPYFMVSKKDIEMNGNNPTLLYGYGGFEISMLPRYSATVGTAWLERGGVYAIANIRGGGEFGPKWHLAALKENRQRAYDDFIAVAEDLISIKVTSPQHLGIQGGSNGGLLVGVALTERPDLYNAVVCRVPLLDMKRYNKLLAGASWMGEYGNPDIPEEWAYISKYSPYQNIKKDVKYPQAFFNTSTRDDRVHPGHARKMVAKMEAMGHEVYYYENIEGGHAAATTNQQAAYQNALIYAYLWKQLR